MAIYGVEFFGVVGDIIICNSSSSDVLVKSLFPTTMETFICWIRTHVLRTIIEG